MCSIRTYILLLYYYYPPMKMYNPRVYEQQFTVFPKSIIFRAGLELVLNKISCPLGNNGTFPGRRTMSTGSEKRNGIEVRTIL